MHIMIGIGTLMKYHNFLVKNINDILDKTNNPDIMVGTTGRMDNPDNKVDIYTQINNPSDKDKELAKEIIKMVEDNHDKVIWLGDNLED